MFQIAGLLFWLVIVPFCIGLVPAGFIAEERRSPGLIFLAGYFTMWALYGVVTIPIVLFVKYDNFILASNCFMALGILGAAAGVWLVFGRGKSAAAGVRFIFGRGEPAAKGGRPMKGAAVWGGNPVRAVRKLVGDMSWAERVEWLLFLLLFGLQLYKGAAYASYDGDDAYYVVESLIAQQVDTMYSILPYTGRHTGLDIRHALAVFPMWIAFVAKKSHIHATILSHTVMPFALIPLTYLVYYKIRKALSRRRRRKHSSVRKRRKSSRADGSAGKKGAPAGTKKGTGRGKGRAAPEEEELFNKENLPIFMVLMAVFQVFGNVSIYTNETFFLTRTWQGKSVAGSLVIPAMFWLFLLLYDKTGRKYRVHGKRPVTAGLWFLLVCVNITAGICSSIAVFLVSMLMAAAAVCLAFVERDYKVALKMGAACIPNAVYVLTYLVVGYGYLVK